MLRAALLAHYDAHARHLPWRETSDPYAIWISEVMSQQTRVETVIPYWERWLVQYPTMEALADADQDDVLKSWEGLGYYSRARNLHAGAAVVRERFGGQLPQTAVELQEVPGIGPYTAGAIASIAFGEPVPAVDGNVRRVFSRLFDLPDPSPADLRELGAELVDPDRPGDFNQAVMELGATICTPRSPSCPNCPVRPQCRSFAAGTVGDRPRRKKKAPVPTGLFLTTVLLSDHHVLLVKRGPGLLEGLWSFPEATAEGAAANGKGAGPGSATYGERESAGAEAARRLASDHGARPISEPKLLGEVEHVFSHLRATYRVTLMSVSRESAHDDNDVTAAAWVSLDRIDDLALPTGQKRILEMLLRQL